MRPSHRWIGALRLALALDGRWILLSIERGAEGDHNLGDAIVASPVLSGSETEAAVFTERWTLALDGSEAHPWRVVAADPRAVTAHS